MSDSATPILKSPKEVVIVLRLLVLTCLAMLGLAQPPHMPGIFWCTVIGYGLTNLSFLLSRTAHLVSPRVQLAIFLFDVAVVSLLVVARGSNVPEFIVAYFSLVLMAATLQGLGTSVFNAVFISALYAAFTMWGRPLSTLLSFSVLSQFAFFVVIAVFMGHVAEESRARLRERAHAAALALSLETAVAEKTRDLRHSLDQLEAAKSRLEANERLTALGMLSAGIAHEIRNPLAAIVSALEEAPVLLDDLDMQDMNDAGRAILALLRMAMQDGREACLQLSRVAGDLTTVARNGPHLPVAVDTREALETAARLLKHRAKDGLRMVVSCTTNRRLLADPGRLQQVLINLAGNGFDAMEGLTGTLRLAAEDGPDDTVVLHVEDQGVGMSPAVKARAFQAFFTTKGPGKGTGLGLHLVREMVRAHDALIDLESDPGVGTKFHVTWPAAAAAAPVGELSHA